MYAKCECFFAYHCQPHCIYSVAYRGYKEHIKVKELLAVSVKATKTHPFVHQIAFSTKEVLLISRSLYRMDAKILKRY